MKTIQNIAHRGLWDESVPQNTLEAFRRAWAAGATWVETDFHHTASGQMICIHAENELRRYTGCMKEIAGLSPEEVSALRLDPVRFATGKPSPSPVPGFRIPLLDEVLATMPDHGTLQAEIKGYSPQYADLFDAAVRNAGLSESNIVVSSFGFDSLKDFHERKPAYRTLILVRVPENGGVDVFSTIRRCSAAGIWAFCPGLCDGDRPLSDAEAAAVRAAGLSLRVYGVNTPEALRSAATLGAEAFTCNYWRKAFDWATKIGGVELLA